MVRITATAADTQEDLLTKDALAFLRVKSTINSLTAEATALRNTLADAITVRGEEDESGNFWLDVPANADGIVALKYERRVSQKLDEQVAEEVLRESDLYDRCVTMTPVINQDEIMACLVEGALTEEQVEAMFPAKITWALVPSKKR